MCTITHGLVPTQLFLETPSRVLTMRTWKQVLRVGDTVQLDLRTRRSYGIKISVRA
eukprot:COSAG02_NODE_40279_length_407_cov_0.840909_1_plen_55_part_01